MFSYPDAARYRLGVNYQQLPCNAPISPVYSPYQRDGSGTINGNYGADPDYVRSSFRPIAHGPKDTVHDEWVGRITAYASEVTDDDFVQARDLWNLFGQEKGQQEDLIRNLTGHLQKAVPQVQAETVRKFALAIVRRARQ